ncbi:MAG: outer membrane lipoprotein carrier protein LolA [Proteobacteria bacterium]|nr:MAG: outer membrane lipoprotein carrier protein LolA [Pseudomonadota bacterium]
MNGRRRFVAVLPMVAALALGVASTVARAAALAQLRAFLADTRSARGEFTQKVLRDGSVAESMSGDFAFARPGRFRWEVRKPFEQLLVADGQRLWFYDKDLNQVTVRQLSDALASTPAAILFGDADPERDFRLRELAQRDGLEWVEALPRSKEAGFERIALGMRDGLPVSMEVADAFGRTTVFGFGAIARNASPAPELFRFVPPKGADVVGQ